MSHEKVSQSGLQSFISDQTLAPLPVVAIMGYEDPEKQQQKALEQYDDPDNLGVALQAWLSNDDAVCYVRQDLPPELAADGTQIRAYVGKWLGEGRVSERDLESPSLVSTFARSIVSGVTVFTTESALDDAVMKAALNKDLSDEQRWLLSKGLKDTNKYKEVVSR